MEENYNAIIEEIDESLQDARKNLAKAESLVNTYKATIVAFELARATLIQEIESEEEE